MNTQEHPLYKFVEIVGSGGYAGIIENVGDESDETNRMMDEMLDKVSQDLCGVEVITSLDAELKIRDWYEDMGHGSYSLDANKEAEPIDDFGGLVADCTELREAGYVVN